MKRISLFILSVLITFIANAQGENTAHQWYFGYNAGVDFSTGIPVSKTDGQIAGFEGCATVGDVNGNLLFYTDGENIYNKNNQIMQNGSGLLGHSSATQSSIIIPMPGSNSLYYVFTVDAVPEHHAQNGLRYSIVDMNLDSGLGGVTSTKNILLQDLVTEKLTAVMHANNLNVWLVAHKWDSDEFVVYEVSSSGINTTPIITSIGSVHEGGYSAAAYYNGWTNGIGCMKSNMQGTKIALAIHRMSKFELFDFNKSTGELSNYYVSPTTFDDAYGVEFSPNSNYLYATQSVSAKLYQFDITQTDPFSNPILIDYGGSQHRALQLGPNGKIYLSRFYSNYLGVINNPNSLGLASEFVEEGVYLDGEECKGGLPTLFYYKGFEFFTGSEVDTSICEGDSVFLQNAYQTVEATYYDTLQTSLGWDSIVNTHLTVLSVAAAPIITENTGVLTSSAASNYQWYFNGNIIVGATNQQYQPLTNGNYSVVIDNGNGCFSFSDDVNFVYTQLDALNKYGINIYPNPVINKLIISNEQLLIKYIGIYNITGAKIDDIESEDNKIMIDFSKYKKGVYLLKLRLVGGDLINYKIVKE